ncbi:MAG: V/A-type H+/Na+-transporting ATPase subunit E [Candidatus Argoarchaeum ethanivorans]|uniref:A-type ATP synthase subunit E n=1 Tax=Candidatus Argoarchaeum ethanivorans TaxID=2608793 RepID=A0A8B3S4G6_9EURY|nr:MAG: V/A-type H+/Na+-transporting ATPase subunit E [Candidatus Argoarchaeum ethanivorans]
MGLETVVAGIIEKGKEQTKVILQEADEEVTGILKKAKGEAEKEREELEDAVRAEAEQLKKQEISSAHLRVKREALNARQAMFEEVQKNVADRIGSISDEKNAKFLEALLKKHATAGSRIYSNKKDKTLVERISKLEYAGSIDCLGGVVIESSDRTVQYDYTYDTILQDINEKSLKQVSGMLLG